MSDPYTDELNSFKRKKRNKQKRKRKNKSRDEYRKTMKRCKYCKSTENLTVDHKVPLSKGGVDKEINWQCLCYECNANKSSRSEKEIRHLFKWFLKIQESRVKHGKKPYTLR